MDFLMFFLVVGVIALIIGGDRNCKTLHEKISDVEFELQNINEKMKELLEAREEE